MKRKVLIVVLGIVGLTLLGTLAGLLYDGMNWFESVIFITMMMASIYCVPAVAAVFLWDRGIWPAAMLAVLALCALATVSLGGMFYIDYRAQLAWQQSGYNSGYDYWDHPLYKLAVWLAVAAPFWAVALVIAAGMHIFQMRGRLRMFRRGTVIGVMVAAGSISLSAGIATFDLVDYTIQEWLIVTSAVLTGAALAACLAVLVMLKVTQIDRRNAMTFAGADLDLACPRCHLRQTLTTGVSRCARCRLKFTIDIDEPHCPKCDYLLHNLTQPVCPECGTQLSADEVATEVTPA